MIREGLSWNSLFPEEPEKEKEIMDLNKYQIKKPEENDGSVIALIICIVTLVITIGFSAYSVGYWQGHKKTLEIIYEQRGQQK